MSDTTTETAPARETAGPGSLGGGGGGFMRFWTTMPGVLTALAAVLTAVAGLQLAGGGSGSGGTDLPPPSVAVPAPAPAPTVAPTVPLATPMAPTVPLATPVDDATRCGRGDEGACNRILRSLVDACSAGDGFACDTVYEVTEAGSELEWFGATCGYFFTTDFFAASMTL